MDLGGIIECFVLSLFGMGCVLALIALQSFRNSQAPDHFPVFHEEVGE